MRLEFLAAQTFVGKARLLWEAYEIYETHPTDICEALNDTDRRAVCHFIDVYSMVAAGRLAPEQAEVILGFIAQTTHPGSVFEVTGEDQATSEPVTLPSGRKVWLIERADGSLSTVDAVCPCCGETDNISYLGE